MKKYFALLTSCLLGICAQAAAEVPDTLIDVRNVHRVTVTQNDSVMRLELKGQGTDSAYRHTFTYHSDNTSTTVEKSISKMNFNLVSFGIKKKSNDNAFIMRLPSIGFVTALDAPKEMDVTMGSSIEVMWEIFTLHYGLRNPRHALEIGFGLDWRQLRMTDNVRFDKVDGNIVLGPYPEGAEPHHSRVKVLSLFFPVRYVHNFGNNWKASLGAHFNLNTRASVKSLYRNAEGARIKDFYRGIHQQRITADIVGQLSYHGVGVYVKYSPCHLFEKGHGPQFQSMAVGIALNL